MFTIIWWYFKNGWKKGLTNKEVFDKYDKKWKDSNNSWNRSAKRGGKEKFIHNEITF